MTRGYGFLRALPHGEQGVAYSFVIVDSRTKQLLGTCGIDYIHPVHRFANLGYWIRTSRTREGEATEGDGTSGRIWICDAKVDAC